MDNSIDIRDYLKVKEKKYDLEDLIEKAKTNYVVAAINTVELNHDYSLDSSLLTITSKLSNTHPELALKVLSICANDDIPRSKILNYTIKLLEDIKSDKN